MAPLPRTKAGRLAYGYVRGILGVLLTDRELERRLMEEVAKRLRATEEGAVEDATR